MSPKPTRVCYGGVVAYHSIENYGIVGDLHTVALVGRNGSIDFMCSPRFDSPSVFAALLDDKRGGRFQLAPVLDGARLRQLYLPDTSVLLTRFLSDDGVAEVSDFMPVEEAGGAHNLVRRAKTVRGEMRFRMRCQPRFDYARGAHTVERTSDGVLFISRGNHDIALRLRSRVPLRIEDGAALAEFTLGADESAAFVLEQVLDGDDSPTDAPDYVADAFKSTVNFWRRWIGRSTYRGRWREMVNRSALTLKLLTSREYGSIVAAPTFGLPEVDRRRPQLGLPLHLDSRRLVHALRAHAARVHGGGRRLHALGRGTLRGARARRLAPDHVRHRRPPRSHRRPSCPASRGLPGLEAGAHRQRGARLISSSTSTAS